jgi:type IV secretory pathway TrbL component
MKLNVKAFSLTCALIWGFGLFLLTWWVMAFDGITRETFFIGRLYRGYNISPLGSVIGFIWAFVDALVGGAIFAWLYNAIAKTSVTKAEIHTDRTQSQIRANAA